MSIKGVSLVPGTIVVLSLDGTLVYVEDIQPTYAAVVALPEQLSDKPGVFTPGKVGAKKISPFSSADKHVHRKDLSPRNLNFINTYGDLRMAHGPHFVERTPEEEAAMSVRKATQIANIRTPREGVGKRAQKRAALKAKKCAACGEQAGHPNHPDVHAFVTAEVATESPTTSAGHARTPRSSAPACYTLASADLTAARAQPRGDKFNEGNRSHRVVLALASLPNKSGTLDEVVGAMCADGKTPPSNPAKIVRRTLNQLTKAAFGSCVSTDVPLSAGDDSETDVE